MIVVTKAVDIGGGRTAIVGATSPDDITIWMPPSAPEVSARRASRAVEAGIRAVIAELKARTVLQ